MNWQPIETAPTDVRVIFWLEPLDLANRDFCGLSGVFLGRFKSWPALSKATHWMPLPGCPSDFSETPPKSIASRLDSVARRTRRISWVCSFRG